MALYWKINNNDFIVIIVITTCGKVFVGESVLTNNNNEKKINRKSIRLPYHLHLRYNLKMNVF